MPVDSSGQPTVLVPAERAVDFARRAFVAAGVPDGDALNAATAIADADLYGVSTHGLKNLPGYIRSVREGRLRARPEIRVTAASGGLCQMSGGGGLGHVCAHYGMEQAIALAREHGVGCVFMRESSHYGASGYWARLASRQGLAGFAVTNAGASLAPWGGTEPRVGNNPPSWALPAPPARTAACRTRSFWIWPSRSWPATAWTSTAGGGSRCPKAGRSTGTACPAPIRRPGPATAASSPSPATRASAWPPCSRSSPPCSPAGRSTTRSTAATSPAPDAPTGSWPSTSGRSSRSRASPAGRGRSPPGFASSRPREGVARVYAPGDIENEIARRQTVEGIRYEAFVVDDLRRLAGALAIPFALDAGSQGG